MNPVFGLAYAPRRAGYRFAAWQSGGNDYAQGSRTAFGADTLLTAGWNAVRVTGIELSSSILTLGVGVSANLEASVLPTDALNRDVTWTSGNSSVATVDQNGVVTTLGTGAATIMATTQDGDFPASCDITVTNIAVPVTHVNLSASDAALFVGEGVQLSAQVFPAGATINGVAWSSSDPAVASIGQSGYVQSHSVGTATITLQSLEGGKTSTCTVTVQPISVTGVVLPSARDMLPGGTAQLTAGVSPGNAMDKRLVWESSDPLVANVDENGNVTALGQ